MSSGRQLHWVALDDDRVEGISPSRSQVKIRAK
jgi:hypothetical protein